MFYVLQQERKQRGREEEAKKVGVKKDVFIKSLGVKSAYFRRFQPVFRPFAALPRFSPDLNF